MLIINGKILTMADKEYANGYVRIADSRISPMNFAHRQTRTGKKYWT